MDIDLTDLVRVPNGAILAGMTRQGMHRAIRDNRVTVVTIDSTKFVLKSEVISKNFPRSGDRFRKA